LAVKNIVSFTAFDGGSPCGTPDLSGSDGCFGGGSFRGVSGKCLIFEDNSGTIRLAFIEQGLHNFVEVKRP
jgi:hypothetical protein